MKRNTALFFAILMMAIAAISSYISNSDNQNRIVDVSQIGAPPIPETFTVPGGGLSAHEKLGGHLILQHVGKTELQLKQRLARDSITSASSFYDLGIAEIAVSQAIKQNEPNISAYLRSHNSNYLSITYRAPSSVGILVSKAKPVAIDVNGVKVILTKSQITSVGYRIVTGYPIK